MNGIQRQVPLSSSFELASASLTNYFQKLKNYKKVVNLLLFFVKKKYTHVNFSWTYSLKTRPHRCKGFQNKRIDISRIVKIKQKFIFKNAKISWTRIWYRIHKIHEFESRSWKFRSANSDWDLDLSLAYEKGFEFGFIWTRSIFEPV